MVNRQQKPHLCTHKSLASVEEDAGHCGIGDGGLGMGEKFHVDSKQREEVCECSHAHTCEDLVVASHLLLFSVKR